MVVAQAVEHRHSVCAGQVQILERTWPFQFRIAVNLFLLGIWLSLRSYSRMVHTPSSSFLFLVIIVRCKIHQLVSFNVQRIERQIQKEAEKGPIKKFF